MESLRSRIFEILASAEDRNRSLEQLISPDASPTRESADQNKTPLESLARLVQNLLDFKASIYGIPAYLDERKENHRL
jgi:hypothetical protein